MNAPLEMADIGCADRCLIGGGEMGRLVRGRDWAETPLGPVETWPESLRTAVSLVLNSNFPIALAWGPNHIQLYNDGYWPLCGLKHPAALGQDFTECWASAFPVIGDAFRSALAGRAAFLEDQRMFLDRLGHLEETFFTFSFSPIRDEHGNVAGLFHPVTETTVKMLAQRRIAMLHELTAIALEAESVAEALQRAAKILGAADRDVPFALFYTLEENGRTARLVAQSGLEAGGPASPALVDLTKADSGWPLARALAAGTAESVEDVAARFPELVCGPYPEPINAARVVPIAPSGDERAACLMVVGVSTRLPWNEAYATFHEMLGTTIGSVLAHLGLARLRRKSAGERAYTEELERRDAENRRLLDTAAQSRRALLGILEDQRRAEEAQRESEHTLHLTLDAAHIGHWALDMATQAATTRSLQHDQIFGYEKPLPEWTYETFLSHVVPEDRERVDALFQAGVREKTDWDYECRILRTDGALRWIWVHGNVFSNAAGEAVRMLGMVTDITARKETEQTMRRERDFSAAVLNSLPGVLYLFDRTGKFLRWNRNFEAVTGYTGAEIATMHPLDFFADAEKELLAARIAEVFERGVSDVEANFVSRDGRQTPYYFTGVTIRLDGEPCLVGTGIDVTARRDAEQALREKEAQLHAADRRLAEIVHGMTEACFALDAEWRFTFVNDRGETLLRQPRAQMIGRTIWEVFPQLADTPLEAHYRRAMRDRVPVAFEVFSPVAERWLDIRLFPTAEGLASFLLDIDARKQAEAAIRQSEERLQAVTENLTEGLVISEVDGRLLHWNRAGLEMYGYESLAEGLRGFLAFADTFELATMDGAVLAFKDWPMKRILRGERLRDFEALVSRRDIEWVRVFSFSGTIIRDASGKPLAFLAINDITARKQAEAAVRESENRFRTMANSMPQLAWIAEADGSIFWYNERWYEYTGTTPEQMEGWGWQSVHDPSVLPEVLEKWRAAIDSGQPFEMQFPLRGADGRFRIFLTRGQPMKNVRGGVARWFGTNTDVDELKRIDRSLRETQARLNSTLSGASVGTWTWDLASDCLVGDEFTARVFSIEVEAAARGLPAAEYLKAVVDGDRPGVADALQSAILSSGQYDVEYRVRQKNGGLRWLQARGRVDGDAEGRAQTFHGAVMDITERKRTEEALRESEEHFRFLDALGEATRQLVEPAEIMAEMAQMLGQHLRASRCAYADVEPDGERFMILHDYTDGCASTVGEYELSLFGPRAVATLHSGRTLIIRDAAAELLPEDGAETFQAIGIQAIITCPLVKEGRLRAMMAVHQAVPRDWTPGEIAMVQDVVERCWATLERRTAEEQIRQLNAELEHRVAERTAQLEAANKELEAFSYSVSHDLRAPLRTVDGFSQAVLEDYGPHIPLEGRRYLETIRHGAQRMGRLIDDLLTFARLSRAPLQRHAIDAAALLREIWEDLTPQHTGRPVELQVGALPPCHGDPALLRQVWVNLLSNALKYSRLRDPAVIEIGSTPGDGATVYFVRDNGAGFDMRYAHKLFGVFQRLHRVEEYEGTGVGLAIVQRVIHRHGGRIWAEAALDRGATFFFTLPETENHAN